MLFHAQDQNSGDPGSDGDIRQIEDACSNCSDSEIEKISDHPAEEQPVDDVADASADYAGIPDQFPPLHRSAAKNVDYQRCHNDGRKKAEYDGTPRLFEAGTQPQEGATVFRIAHNKQIPNHFDSAFSPEMCSCDLFCRLIYQDITGDYSKNEQNTKSILHL